MTIQAKFNSKCPACKASILVGEKVEWQRGTPARHATATQCFEAQQRDAAQPKLDVEPARLTLSPIVQFLQAAKDRGLKRPKLRVLDIDGRTELRLSITTAGYNPGSVAVKRGDMFIGLVKPSGEMTREVVGSPALQAHLAQIAKDPARAAKDYAAVMCQCSFCGKPLTDVGSVDVGYGPVCAKNWGLPHSALGTSVLLPVPGTALPAGNSFTAAHGMKLMPPLQPFNNRHED